MRKWLFLLLCLLALSLGAVALGEAMPTETLDGVLVEIAPDGTLLFDLLDGNTCRLRVIRKEDAPAFEAAMGQVVRVHVRPSQTRADEWVAFAPLEEAVVEAEVLKHDYDRRAVYLEGPGFAGQWVQVADDVRLHNLKMSMRFRPEVAPSGAAEDPLFIARDVRGCYRYDGNVVARQTGNLILRGPYETVRIIIGPDTALHTEATRWENVTIYATTADMTATPPEVLAWSVWPEYAWPTYPLE